MNPLHEAVDSSSELNAELHGEAQQCGGIHSHLSCAREGP